MAESEQSDKNISAPPQRRSYHQNRPSSSYRGRGRANASVNKALHFFGVRDLREILDRKHQEQDEAYSGPPPDPSYNYLKDPSRENTNEQQTHRYQKEQHSERPSGDGHQRSFSFRGRGRGRGTHRENRHFESEKAFIQNPVNIKVELTASTGERNYKIDEDTKLPDIKHVPNYQLKDLRPTKTENRKDNERNKNERGRGRGQRRGWGRGRGARGRSRGQGWYSSNRNDRNQENAQSLAQNTPEVESEENWDTPPKNPTCENAKTNQEETVEGEGYDEDNEEQVIDHEEEYHDGGDDGEYLEANNEGTSEINIKLEENLIITSGAREEKHKRTVKFKLDDEQGSKEAQEKLQSKEVTDGKETSKKEEIQGDDSKKVD